MTPTQTITSQQLIDMIRATDLLAPDEKETLISYMPNFTQEERDLLGGQIVGYEHRKMEIIKDAEEQKRKIEVEYYKQLQLLYQEQQKLLRTEIKRREEEEHEQSEEEASKLIDQM